MNDDSAALEAALNRCEELGHDSVNSRANCPGHGVHFKPLVLTGTFAGQAAGRRRAIALMMGIACVRRKQLAAMYTAPQSVLPHVVPLARSTRLTRTYGGRRLKKIPEGKKVPVTELVNQEENEEEAPVSDRQISASFRLAATRWSLAAAAGP